MSFNAHCKKKSHSCGEQSDQRREHGRKPSAVQGTWLQELVVAPVCHWAHLHSTSIKPAFHFFTSAAVWSPPPSVSFLPLFYLSPLLYPPFPLCHLPPHPCFPGSFYVFITPPAFMCGVQGVKSSDIIFLCSTFSCCLCHLSVVIRFSISHTQR